MGFILRRAMQAALGVGIFEYDMGGARPVAISLPIRPGYSKVTVEVIGYGEDSSQRGGYSRKNSKSLAGLTALYLHVPNDDSGVYVRENNAAGAIIAKARYDASDGVGDVKFSGAAQPAGYAGNGTGSGWLNKPPGGLNFGNTYLTAGSAGGVLLKWEL